MGSFTAFTSPGWVLLAGLALVWLAGMVLLRRDRRRTRAVMTAAERERRVQAVTAAAEAASSQQALRHGGLR